MGSRVRGGECGRYALSGSELKAILSACGTLEDRVMIMLAVSLGLRRADLAGIRIADIDLTRGMLTFFEHKKKRHRTLPLSPRLKQEIGMLIKTLPKKREYLFRCGDRQMYNRFIALCDIAGIPRRPFHALRATCVKRCLAKGWSIEQIAELTGDTIEVIQYHYSVPSLTEMQEVMTQKDLIEGI